MAGSLVNVENNLMSQISRLDLQYDVERWSQLYELSKDWSPAINGNYLKVTFNPVPTVKASSKGNPYVDHIVKDDSDYIYEQCGYFNSDDVKIGEILYVGDSLGVQNETGTLLSVGAKWVIKMVGTGEIINLYNPGTVRTLQDGRFTNAVTIVNTVIPMGSNDINVTSFENFDRVIGRQELLDYVVKDDITYLPLKIQFKKIPNYVDLKQYSTKLEYGESGTIKVVP